MLITSNGKVVINELDVVTSGTATVSGNGQLSLAVTVIDSEGDEPVKATITGDAHATAMTLSTVYQGETLTWALSRDEALISLYNQAANLATLAGTYEPDPEYEYAMNLAGSAVIDNNGDITYTPDGLDCNITGTLITINPEFNECSVAIDATACGDEEYFGWGAVYTSSEGKQGLFLTTFNAAVDGYVWLLGVKQN